MVCPFDAISFHAFVDGQPARVVALKCDGCIDRLRRGQAPACVESCVAHALVHGDLNQLIAADRGRQALALLTTIAKGASHEQAH